MKSYRASISINASPEKVWKVLADASGYPAWDLSMDHIDGSLALGETVTFFTKLSAQSFPVKVTAFEPGEKNGVDGRPAVGII